MLGEPVADVIRRELRRVSPDVRIETDQIKAVLTNEVLKLEVINREKADEARKKRRGVESVRAQPFGHHDELLYCKAKLSCEINAAGATFSDMALRVAV